MTDWERVRRLWRRFFSLCWPVATDQFFRTLMRTTDVFVTALISPVAVVAVGLGDLYAGFPLRIGLGLGGGVIAISSQDTGGEAYHSRDEAITQALLIGGILGVPFVALGALFGGPMIALLGAETDVIRLGGSYLAIILATAPARHVALVGAKALQGTGDTRSPMYANVAGNVVNVSISLVFGLGIFGVKRLGVIGVGLGTAIGNVLTAGLILSLIARPSSDAGFSRPREVTITRQLLVVSLPRMLEGFVTTITRFPFNAILLGYGTTVNAGYQVGRRIYQQVAAPLSRSVRTAASIMVGQRLGSGDERAARYNGWWVVGFGLLLVGGIGLIVVVTAEPVVRLFSADPTTIRYGTNFARTFGLTAGPAAVFFGLSGALQGAGETRSPFWARLIGVVVFMIGFSYVVGTVLGYGPIGAYLGIAFSYLAMAGIITWRYARGDWADRATAMMTEREKKVG